MPDLTPEQEAEAERMGLTPDEYLKRAERFWDWQPRVVGHIDLTEPCTHAGVWDPEQHRYIGACKRDGCPCSCHI